MENHVDLTILECPACKGVLEELTNSLECVNCKQNYPATNAIFRFARDDGYVGNFSFEWQIHKKTQLDSNKNGSSHANFNERFGFSEGWWEDKKVLDIGVGVGRYAQIPIENGAEVHGVDLSYAIDVAKKNLPKLLAYQADLFCLPFKKETFDVIYSFGVLHHTPNPKEAFKALLPLLKPGGLICITLYENHGMYHTSRFLRRLTTKIPNLFLYPMVALYTALMYVPYRFLGLKYGIIGRIAPISLSNNIIEAILDTFDCYSPKYQYTFSDDEVFGWFKESGLVNIEVRPQPVTIYGYKLPGNH
jgi:2-polyprenyl-3-methyl-5-hydroxy-6-metoxy-1,4-benzoquinol methylase